jgi:hypothetical protein
MTGTSVGVLEPDPLRSFRRFDIVIRNFQRKKKLHHHNTYDVKNNHNAMDDLGIEPRTFPSQLTQVLRENYTTKPIARLAD